MYFVIMQVSRFFQLKFKFDDYDGNGSIHCEEKM